MSEVEEPALSTPAAINPPVDQADMAHKEFRDDDYWRVIPAYANLRTDEFNDHRFQSRNSITSLKKLQQVVGNIVPDSFYQDVEKGLALSPMSVRISPYLISLIDWTNPVTDPLRIQFLPMGSRMLPDHPELTLDSLHEQEDSPVPGLTHRYADRALFLTLDTCPVYCRFCTRSYAVGLDTEEVQKVHFGAIVDRWEQIFAYIESRPELEDIVISGGDVANLKAEHIEYIGDRLLKIDHVRRMRYATKAPAIMPQKLITDTGWVDALTRVVEKGRKMHKEVVLHTHFNHPHEISDISRRGLNRLMERGIVVRNQMVLQRGVNDDVETLHLLIRRLSYINVHPYYTFLHDMVRGVEELRTTLGAALDLEKHVRGRTAGYNTPTFVLDTMGGGGKRNVHSYEHYDRETGIAVFTSPTVRPGELFYYFDPIDELDPLSAKRWHNPTERKSMLKAALYLASCS